MNKVKQILLIGTICAAALWAGTRVVGGFDFAHITTPSAPASGLTTLYAKTDGRLYMLPSGGSEALVQGVGRSSVKFETTSINGTTGWDQDVWIEAPGTSTEAWDIGGLHDGTDSYATANRTGKWLLTLSGEIQIDEGFAYVTPCVNGSGLDDDYLIISTSPFGDFLSGGFRWTGVLHLSDMDTVSSCIYRELSADDSANNVHYGGSVELTDLGF